MPNKRKGRNVAATAAKTASPRKAAASDDGVKSRPGRKAAQKTEPPPRALRTRGAVAEQIEPEKPSAEPEKPSAKRGRSVSKSPARATKVPRRESKSPIKAAPKEKATPSKPAGRASRSAAKEEVKTPEKTTPKRAGRTPAKAAAKSGKTPTKAAAKSPRKAKAAQPVEEKQEPSPKKPKRGASPKKQPAQKKEVAEEKTPKSARSASPKKAAPKPTPERKSRRESPKKAAKTPEPVKASPKRTRSPRKSVAKADAVPEKSDAEESSVGEELDKEEKKESASKLKPQKEEKTEEQAEKSEKESDDPPKVGKEPATQEEDKEAEKDTAKEVSEEQKSVEEDSKETSKPTDVVESPDLSMGKGQSKIFSSCTSKKSKYEVTKADNDQMEEAVPAKEPKVDDKPVEDEAAVASTTVPVANKEMKDSAEVPMETDEPETQGSDEPKIENQDAELEQGTTSTSNEEKGDGDAKQVEAATDDKQVEVVVEEKLVKEADMGVEAKRAPAEITVHATNTVETAVELTSEPTAELQKENTSTESSPTTPSKPAEVSEKSEQEEVAASEPAQEEKVEEAKDETEASKTEDLNVQEKQEEKSVEEENKGEIKQADIPDITITAAEEQDDEEAKPTEDESQGDKAKDEPVPAVMEEQASEETKEEQMDVDDEVEEPKAEEVNDTKSADDEIKDNEDKDAAVQDNKDKDDKVEDDVNNTEATTEEVKKSTVNDVEKEQDKAEVPPLPDHTLSDASSNDVVTPEVPAQESAEATDTVTDAQKTDDSTATDTQKTDDYVADGENGEKPETLATQESRASDGFDTDTLESDSQEVKRMIAEKEADKAADQKPVKPTMRSKWSDTDTWEYRNHYPGKEDDLKQNKNLLFYQNQISSRPDGGRINEIHDNWWGDYRKLEVHHGYIQWLFPIREKGMNYQSQELQNFEAEGIRSDSSAKQRVLRSYEMMLDFYGMKLVDADSGKMERADNWKGRFDHLNQSFHNYLRITRILKSLGELGYEHLKAPFVEFVLREAYEAGTLTNCRRSCGDYWVQTIRSDDERRRIVEKAEEYEEKYPSKNTKSRWW